MRRIMDQVARIGPGTAPVLVLGETGTGKELVARAVHASGPRGSGPFIAVNCAALPRELVESELFGYQRGAFSGAVSEGLGLFRAADGGTLFLDEVTEMPPELQAKLLRVLQEGAVRPVGAVREIPIDVRVIASSNRDPESALAAGLLRPDLYYRLSVSTVRLPPLRDRREDIAPLALHYLAVINRRYRNQPQGARIINAAAVHALEARQWPGNVRELFNVIENAYAMCRTEEIGESDLGEATGARLDDERPGALRPFEAAERDLIERTLAATGGNKLQAARDLGISRTKLYAKITKYRLVSSS
jgi:DNA-binding NtrC family response regulator